MGFDPDKIPIVAGAFRSRRFPLADHEWRDIKLRSNHESWNKALTEIQPEDTFHFEPHFGWKGHIENAGVNAEAFTR